MLRQAQLDWQYNMTCRPGNDSAFFKHEIALKLRRQQTPRG